MFRVNALSPLDFSAGKVSRLFALLLISLFSQFAFSQNAEAQKTPDAVILETDKTIERELAGQQKHGYQINLSANQYAKVIIRQRGIDVAARLFGTDGKKSVADFDAEMRPDGTETIEFVAGAEVVYRLDVSAKYPLLPAGKYEIRLAALHQATEQEKILQEARNLYAESLRFYNSGEYTDAQLAVERVVEIRQKQLGAENPATATALTQLARLLDVQAKYDEAEQLNLKILAVREKILGADHPDTGYTLNYLALNYVHKDDFPKAVAFHQRALAVREKNFGAAHPIVAASLINLGVVYDELGDELKARELYQRALNIQEQTVGIETLNAAIVLNNIGKIYNDSYEYKKAEPVLLKAATILEKLYSAANPRVADVLVNLAHTYAGLGDLDESEAVYRRVLNLREKTVEANHPLIAHATFNLANLYALKNEFAKAEPLYRRALEINETALGPDNPKVSESLSALALLLARQGDVEQAVKLQERANRIDERNISLNLTIGSERQKLAYLKSLFDRTNQSVFLQIKFAPNNALAAELAATTVLRQKGRVLDAVANDLIELRRRSNAQDQTLLDNLNKITEQIAELILNGPEDETVAGHQSKIKKLTDEREKLEDEISQRAAGFYAKSEAVTLQAIQAHIPPNAALIEFAVYTVSAMNSITEVSGETRYAVYVLRNQGEVKWKDLGDAGQIDEAVKAYRQALRDPKREDVQRLARAADEKIMQPVRALLGDARQLLVSPDGELNLIPFEALVDEQAKFLVENYSFTYLTSGRDLLRMQTARTSKSKSLIVANPTFGEPSAAQTTSGDSTKTSVRRDKRRITAARDLSGVYFTQLSGTAQEARLIQTIFPDATFLTGAQATESTLKQIAAPHILHIATHGFFLEDAAANSNSPATMRGLSAGNRIENPLLRSGLALSNANRRGAGDDGILTALEASGLNLWGTKLVVLSACDTGIGEVKNGEGVYGLRRAFVLAGAESMVMSLWSISDFVTRELMTNYYKNLKQGLGRGAALRHVQLEMLKRSGRGHPFYWAGFIQSGEWAALDGKR